MERGWGFPRGRQEGVSAGLTKGKKGAKKLQLKTLTLQPNAAEFDESCPDEHVHSFVGRRQSGQPILPWWFGLSGVVGSVTSYGVLSNPVVFTLSE